jgi:hypothetical protein
MQFTREYQKANATLVYLKSVGSTIKDGGYKQYEPSLSYT